MLTYNQNGSSRGIATIIFGKADTAAKAAKDLNGLLVDGRPMKVNFSISIQSCSINSSAQQIEVVYDASHAPTAPAAKPLTERVA